MGGMAEVFLARALGAGGISKFFAIKRILPQYADSPEFIEMFREEAKIAINLKHSNIVSIHEFGIQDQQFFLVMDYVEGKNLRQILNKMKKAKVQFSIEHIVYLIREIAAGLDHAHRCIDATTGKPLNITHRDMSPQNVMVSFDGEVKIVDFGIAKAESQVETTRAGTLKGKFGYMSPEQAEGLSVDMRTDIFSLGIVLWEILANDRLFTANNEINTLRKIRDCHIPSLRKINPNIQSELEKIVQKALARDKNLRYQSAAALHKDLNRFLNRQYPDFSSHDFAGFIKSIFADEILESRKKLVTYAKSSLVDIAVTSSLQSGDDKTMITSSLVDAQTSSYVATETEKSLSNTSPSFTGLSVQTKTNSPGTSTQQTSATVLDSSFFAQQNSSTSPSHALSESSYHTQTGFNSPLNSQTRSRINIPVRSHEQKSSVSIFILWSVAGLIVFMALVKFMPSQMSGAIELTQPVFGALYKKMGVSGNADKASQPSPVPQVAQTQSTPPSLSPASSRSLVVVSDPSGAEIYINGKKTGQITPSRLSLPDQAFTLELVRRGYAKISKRLSGEQIGNKLSFELKKLSLGFIDVDVKPLQNVVIYVDGQRVEGEALPLRNYPIPANKSVKIKVIGQNGGESEKALQLNENQKQRLEFRLYSSRIPSNQ